MNSDSWPQAVLLDFYGTVVEEDDVVIRQICVRIAEASPLAATPEEISSYWGHAFGRMCTQSFGCGFKTQRELERLSLQYVLEQFQCDLNSNVLSAVLVEYWRRPTLFQESREVLARCEVPICLVSNIDSADLRTALEYNDLWFDLVVTNEDCRAYKPRSEMFDRALALLGLATGEVLHVGDGLSSDVRGAKSLAIPVLWINRKDRPTPGGERAPDYVSTDLAGLLSILEGTA
jgi:FMN phosphatase YigB (HAD superfamily)